MAGTSPAMTSDTDSICQTAKRFPFPPPLAGEGQGGGANCPALCCYPPPGQLRLPTSPASGRGEKSRGASSSFPIQSFKQPSVLFSLSPCLRGEGRGEGQLRRRFVAIPLPASFAGRPPPQAGEVKRVAACPFHPDPEDVCRSRVEPEIGAPSFRMRRNLRRPFAR